MAVACGEDFTLTLDDDGNMWFFGSLDHESNILLNNISTPTLLSGVNGVVSIASGAYHIACVDLDGHVWTCGYNRYYQLGNRINEEQCEDLQVVEGLEDVVSVACGKFHTLCVSSQGDVFGFGANSRSQLGIEDKSDKIGAPTKMLEVKNIISVSCGFLHSMMLCSNGELYVCGYNRYYELGVGHNEKQEIPMIHPFLSDIIHISCGSDHTLAMNSNHEVFSFGYNTTGQLGLGHDSKTKKPCLIQNISPIKSLSCGEIHSVIVDFDGNIYACGDNYYGQLGLGEDVKSISTFTKIESLKDVTFIPNRMSRHTIVKSSSEIFVFGSNNGKLALDIFEDTSMQKEETVFTPVKWKDEYNHIIGTPLSERRFKKAKSARK